MPNLFIDIEARFAKFQDSLDTVARNSTRAVKGMESAFRGLSGALKLVGAGFAAQQIGQFFKSIVDGADHLHTVHERTDVAIEDLAGLKFAAEQTGASFDDVAGGIKQLQKAISEAGTGNKELRQLFTDLGMKDAARGAIDAKEAFLQLADVFPRLSQNDQTRVAMDLMKRSADALVPAFKNGRKGLEEFISKGKELNPEIGELGKRANEFNSRMNEVGTALRGALLPFVNAWIPAMTEFAAAMARAAKEGNVLGTAMAALLKLPFDLAGGPKQSAADISQERIAQLRKEIARLDQQIDGTGAATSREDLDRDRNINRRAAKLKEIALLEGRLAVQRPDSTGTSGMDMEFNPFKPGRSSSPARLTRTRRRRRRSTSTGCSRTWTARSIRKSASSIRATRSSTTTTATACCRSRTSSPAARRCSIATSRTASRRSTSRSRCSRRQRKPATRPTARTR